MPEAVNIAVQCQLVKAQRLSKLALHEFSSDRKPIIKLFSFQAHYLQVSASQKYQGTRLSSKNTMMQILGTSLKNASRLRRNLVDLYATRCERRLNSTDVPAENAVYIKLGGFDYATLESSQKVLYGVAGILDIDVKTSFAMPAKNLKVQKLKSSHSATVSDHHLTNYERVIQLVDLDSASYSLWLRIAEAALPAGVKLEALKSSLDFEELRYVPDRQLLELKSQLECMQSAKNEKKK